jgi:hypothetical protein
MKYFFLLITISFIIISCKREDEAFKPVYCSEANPYAPCENQTEKCYKGKCIDKSVRCGGNTDAPCDNGDECRRDEETREYKCFEGRCTVKNPDGYCSRDGESCYYGYCKKPCSPENSSGGCEDRNDVCFDEACLPKDNLCKDGNPNGKCNSKSKCIQQEDGHYKCTLLCHKSDEENPEYSEMPCPNEGEECIVGECLHTDNMCSNNNINGECPSSKVCVKKEGSSSYKCEDKCSVQAPLGVCLGEDQDCVKGNCVFRCSANHPDGYCEDEEVGENGGCEAGTCKKPCGDPEEKEGVALDGYCVGVKWCKNGNCEEPCDINHFDGLCEDDTFYCNKTEQFHLNASYKFVQPFQTTCVM